MGMLKVIEYGRYSFTDDGVGDGYRGRVDMDRYVAGRGYCWSGVGSWGKSYCGREGGCNEEGCIHRIGVEWLIQGCQFPCWARTCEELTP